MFSGGPFWIEAGLGVRLATMPHPRGDALESEAQRLKAAGVDVLVCLLEPLEAVMLNLAREKDIFEARGMEVMRFPIRDHDVPASMDAALELAKTISAKLDEQKSVAIHCYAGIGRSSLIAALVLAVRGMNAGEAFTRISKARGILVPDTPEQLLWLMHLLEQSGSRLRGP